MPRGKEPKKLRGIFEHPPGSNIWWIQYFDAEGKRRREKAGSRGNAIKLLSTRRTEKLKGLKLPDNLRNRGTRFGTLCDDILIYSAGNHRDQRNVKSRVAIIKKDFGERLAESIKPAEIDRWLTENTKTPGTANRYKAAFSLIFREALHNSKVSSNPARLVKQRQEGKGRIRYLNDEEERRIRTAIREHFSEEEAQQHENELTISNGTGMRLSEQYGLEWYEVDFKRKEVRLDKTKNGEARDIPMNRDVLAAFKSMGVKKTGHVFPILNPRKWFAAAMRKAKVKAYRWHDNRHTFCSRLAMAGIGLKTIQTLAGHKTIAITARYAHLALNTLHSAVEVLSGDQVPLKVPPVPSRRKKPNRSPSRPST